MGEREIPIFDPQLLWFYRLFAFLHGQGFRTPLTCQNAGALVYYGWHFKGGAMKVFAVLFLGLTWTALMVVAGDQPQPPAVGDQAPAFSLPDQEGTHVSLNQFKGKWVVLYFYPKDFTSGCTVEAHNFQRDLDKYTQKSAVILGVSVDNVDSHKGFCTKEGLNFKLLADPGHEVVQKYGSIMEYNGMTLAARNTFLIDPSGTIRKVYLKVNPQGHSEEVLADLEQLQAAK
jgi:thioredoxin-dependent peroxiredoxin